jgi:DNA-binding response OmpR family regulator
LAPRILIVNDDDDGLFLMELAVAKEFASATIRKCHTPSEALSHLALAQVDAIITDNGMPDMSGLEMIRRIRSKDQLVPILMVTGAPHIESAAFDAGVSSFSSSGSWDEIRQRIRELLPESPPDAASVTSR